MLVAGTRKFKGVLKRLVKRRMVMIEMADNRLNHDHALGRNFLKDKQGDRIDALMAACGFHLHKLYLGFSDDRFSQSPAA